MGRKLRKTDPLAKLLPIPYGGLLPLTAVTSVLHTECLLLNVTSYLAHRMLLLVGKGVNND